MYSYNDLGNDLVNTQVQQIQNIKPYQDNATSYKKNIKNVQTVLQNDYFCELVDRASGKKTESNTAKYRNELANRIALTVEKLGIFIRQEDILEISLGRDGLIKVAGLGDSRKSHRLEEELNKVITNNGEETLKNIHAVAFYMETGYVKSAKNAKEAVRRANIIELKDITPAVVKEKTGTDIDLAQLAKAADGSISGYPAELEGVLGESAGAGAGKSAADTAGAIKAAVGLILGEGYENIPLAEDVATVFYFTKDDFSNIDLII
jgi:outer membrane lipoprotein SlyB